jgi:hypothetical protein
VIFVSAPSAAVATLGFNGLEWVDEAFSKLPPSGTITVRGSDVAKSLVGFDFDSAADDADGADAESPAYSNGHQSRCRDCAQLPPEQGSKLSKSGLCRACVMKRSK